MKIILAVVRDGDSNRLANKFISANIHITKLPSAGGFLKTGDGTFVIGIDDERVDETLALAKKTCRSGEQYVSTLVTLDITTDGQIPYPMEVEADGATCFVLPVEGFHQY